MLCCADFDVSDEFDSSSTTLLVALAATDLSGAEAMEEVHVALKVDGDPSLHGLHLAVRMIASPCFDACFQRHVELGKLSLPTDSEWHAALSQRVAALRALTSISKQVQP